MSKCELRIELLDEQESYQPGDKVRGLVYVDVNKAVPCEGLTAQLRWRTHGRGNRAMGDPVSVELYRGQWQPGHRDSYEFKLEVPAGPVTYHGNYLNLDWYVQAQADIPWALDPKAETDIVVQRGQYAGPMLHGDPAVTAPTVALQKMAVIPVALFLSIFVLVGLGVLISGVVGVATGANAAWFRIIFGAIFIAAPGLVMLKVLSSRLAERKLGPVELVVEPTTVRGGDTVHCRLSFQPRVDVPLDAVTFTLEGQEVCVSGSGTNRTTHRHEVHKTEEKVLEKHRISRGRPAAFEATFSLPENAPPSLVVNSNQLRWEVRATIAVAAWPDWSEACTLTVEG